MTKRIIFIWLLLLALIAYNNAQAKPLSPNDMACPAKDTGSSSNLDKVDKMPGSENLRKGIVWLDQGRYAAAYTALDDAINQGLPDSIERARVYQQMGLLMCRLDSSESCLRNFELAFMTNGGFELPMTTLQLPHVQDAYRQAQQFFASRCTPAVPSVATQVNVAETMAGAQIAEKKTDRVSLTLMSAKDLRKNKRRLREATATILLRVDPWAVVAIDDSQVVTPPVKELKIKPGIRMLSIKHPNFEPILIEANFKKGQTWVVRQTY